MESTTHSEVSKPLHGMFTSVPPRYDLINHIITLGKDKKWRRLAAEVCIEKQPLGFLDLGCGTGDLMLNVTLMAKETIQMAGLDYSLPMLTLAQQKASRASIGKRVTFIHGEATRMPFPDNYFDCVGISFAFRNLTYKNPLRLPHFSEVKRILKPGGRYVIVESSQPKNRVIRSLFHLYLRAFVAPVGTILSGNSGAYHYLAESAARFYSPEEIKGMLLAAGFSNVSYRPLLFGVAGVHVATS